MLLSGSCPASSNVGPSLFPILSSGAMASPADYATTSGPPLRVSRHSSSSPPPRSATWIAPTASISIALLDPVSEDLPARQMTAETLERLVDSYLFYSFPQFDFRFPGRRTDSSPGSTSLSGSLASKSNTAARGRTSATACRPMASCSMTTGRSSLANIIGCWVFRSMVRKKPMTATASTKLATERVCASDARHRMPPCAIKVEFKHPLCLEPGERRKA